MRWRWLTMLGVACLGCVTPRPTTPALPQLTVSQVEALIPPRTAQRADWAADVVAVLEAQSRSKDLATVCTVLAIVEQESGFDANPAVADLSRIVRRALEEKVSKLGPLAPAVIHEILGGVAEGQTLTFEQRLSRVRTERDVDRIFRDLLAHHETNHPAIYATMNLASGVLGRGALSELNPITTAGSMQVSVRFAREMAKDQRRDLTDDEVREELYTRRGGLTYGTARLLGHDAAYDNTIYRFADYNAGVYASRNAAVQKMLSELTGLTLALDGDLLAYDARGHRLDTTTQSMEALRQFQARHAPSLSLRRIEADARREKEHRFEETETYQTLVSTYRRVRGREGPYAVLPEVNLTSAKLSRQRTTAWFARSVDNRYQRCLKAR